MKTRCSLLGDSVRKVWRY